MSHATDEHDIAAPDQQTAPAPAETSLHALYVHVLEGREGGWWGGEGEGSRHIHSLGYSIWVQQGGDVLKKITDTKFRMQFGTEQEIRTCPTPPSSYKKN